VGSSDTSLTILGSNFGTGSTVLLSGTALAGATIISSTQINVTIPAADLAAAGTPSVTVQNPAATAGAAPVSSNAVQFTIMPSWQQIQTQLSSVAAPLPAYINTYVQLLTMQNNTQAAQIQTDATNYNNLNTQYQTAQATVSQQAATITSLQSQLAASTYQTASPLDVASSFKSVVDQIQQAAQSAGGTQTTVTNMNVQVKSLLSVQGSTATTPAAASMTFFSPQSLPPAEHLSTLSFTFGSIPNLKTAAAANAPQPSSSGSSSSSTAAPAPSPPPTPASSSSSSSSSSAAAAPSIARPQSAATSRVAVESVAASPAKATAAKKADSAKKKG
jgi:glucoamylase